MELRTDPVVLAMRPLSVLTVGTISCAEVGSTHPGKSCSLIVAEKILKTPKILNGAGN
jgi:hypothetical protein